jgi:hypothetical protein
MPRVSATIDDFMGAADAAEARAAIEAVSPDGTGAEAAAFRAAIGADRVIIASHTLTSDATLERGSSTFGTDQTTAAQAILDLAASGPILIIWDVAISCTGLRIRGNTHIIAKPNCGAILRTNSDKALIENYNPSFTTITDENITIDGGIWNGNGATGQQAHDTVSQGWIVGMRFMGVRNLTLRNLSVLQTRTFAVHFGTWERVTCENIYCDNYDDTYNHDGLHFNGPGRWLHVSNLRGYVDDDLLALNANDGTSQSDGSGSAYVPYGGPGDITDVVVDGVALMGGHSGIRLLSSQNRLDRIQIRGVTGSASRQAIIIDSYSEGNWRIGPPGPGNMGSILIDGVDAVLNGSGYKQCLIWVQANVETLRLKNVSRNDFSFALPTLKIGVEAVIGQLIMEGWTSIPALLNSGNAASQITNAGRIASWQILGSNFARTDGAASGSPIINTGVVRQFQVADTQTGGFGLLATNTGTITVDNSGDSQNNALATSWTLESGFGLQNIYDPTEIYTTPPASSVRIAASVASDAHSGNVQVGADIINHSATRTNVLFARGTNTSAWGATSAYAAVLEIGGNLQIVKQTAGTSSVKATLTTIADAGTAYRLVLTTKDSGGNVVVSAQVQRISDGAWLNSSKAWVASSASPPVALTWTDTSSVFSGAGRFGMVVFASGAGQNAFYRNFTTAAAP